MASSVPVATYDLLPKMTPYLDRHLILPMLDFYIARKDIYDEEYLTRFLAHILHDTGIVDLEIDLYIENPSAEQLSIRLPIPSDDFVDKLIEKRANILKKIEERSKITENEEFGERVTSLLERVKISTDRRDFTYSEDDVELVEFLYDSARFHWDCGNYGDAQGFMDFFAAVAPHYDKRRSGVQWGRFAATILLQEDGLGAAVEHMKGLRDIIDETTFGSALGALQQRTWLIHWSLFVFFNLPNGRELLVDVLMKPQYMNAIQTLCPHILRYVVAAVILLRKRAAFREIIEIVQQEAYKYRDPITEFLEALYVKFDFNRAQQILRDCEKVLNNDFFLANLCGEFIENARLFVFETFCRIHQCVSISMLADRLNMSEEEAEKWIVNMIRHNDRLDAKIDSKLGHVFMGTKAVSPYEQVMKKTKSVSFRSQQLCAKLEAKIGEKMLSRDTPWGS